MLSVSVALIAAAPGTARGELNVVFSLCCGLSKTAARSMIAILRRRGERDRPAIDGGIDEAESGPDTTGLLLFLLIISRLRCLPR